MHSLQIALRLYLFVCFFISNVDMTPCGNSLLLHILFRVSADKFFFLLAHNQGPVHHNSQSSVNFIYFLNLLVHIFKSYVFNLVVFFEDVVFCAHFLPNLVRFFAEIQEET